MLKLSVKHSMTLAPLVMAMSIHAKVEIPVVPVDVMTEDVPAPIKPNMSFKQTDREARNTTPVPVQKSAEVDKGSHALIYANDIEVKSGENYILPISNGHVNRIVTPFENPNIATTSAANIEVRSNVVYVGSLSESPITLFITEKGVEGESIGLTLVPKKIPSREIRLAFSKQPGMVRPTGLTQRAKKWEESQPYIETIKMAFRGIALGNIPKGYIMEPTAPMQVLPQCEQEGLYFQFRNGQTISGHNLVILIGVAKNIDTEEVEFLAESCGNWNVSAVSSFPHTKLVPGQKTEVYVAMKKYREETPGTKRPSLLDGGSL